MERCRLVSLLCVLASLLSACVQAHEPQARAPLVRTPTYAISNPEVGQYIIYSNTMDEARCAASANLDCDDDPCLLQPGGVILFVERPGDRIPPTRP